MFYWFFESQRTKDPLLLWLTGGPGCSSLIAALYENGPFVFDTESTRLRANPYSWGDLAHVLYLESPGGVGFSTCSENDYSCDADDKST
jgi:carboxypeptidase C (cathepsin A)